MVGQRWLTALPGLEDDPGPLSQRRPRCYSSGEADDPGVTLCAAKALLQDISAKGIGFRDLVRAAGGCCGAPDLVRNSFRRLSRRNCVAAFVRESFSPGHPREGERVSRFS